MAFNKVSPVLKWAKKISTAMTAAAVLFTVGATSNAAFAEDEKTYRWKMQRYTGLESQKLFRAFAKEVKEASDGRLKISIFTGGELVPNDQLLKATGSGLLQMSYGYGGYWGGAVDLARIESGLPLTWTSLEEANELWYKQGLNDLLVEAYAEHGVRYMSPSFGGYYDLLSKEPVTSLDDMKKIKIRATSNVAAILEKFGIPTVYLPPEEFYTAMSTNSIDGIIYGSAFDYEQLKLQETAKNYTELSLLSPGFVDNILVNEEAYNELPADLQKILDESIKKLAQAHHNWLVDGAKKTIADNIFEVHSLQSGDVAKLTEAAQNLWDEEAKRSDRTEKAISMIKQMAEDSGRLK